MGGLRLFRHVGVVVGVGLLAACAGGTQAPPAPELSGLTRPSSSASSGNGSATPGDFQRWGVAEEPLPIQHYMVVGRERDTIQDAVAVLAMRCMERQGFSMKVQPPRSQTVGVLQDLTYRRYGAPETVEDAKEIGFGVPARAETSAEWRKQAEAFEASLTEAMRHAWTGDPGQMVQNRRRNGCVGDADEALMGDAQIIEASGLANPPLIRDLNFDPRSQESPEATAATERFLACMRDAGYSDVDATEFTPKRFEQEDPQQPSAEARAAALTVHGCFVSSGVREAQYRAEVAYQTAAIEANPEAFAQVRKEIDDVLRRATEVLEQE